MTLIVFSLCTWTIKAGYTDLLDHAITSVKMTGWIRWKSGAVGKTLILLHSTFNKKQKSNTSFSSSSSPFLFFLYFQFLFFFLLFLLFLLLLLFILIPSVDFRCSGVIKWMAYFLSYNTCLSAVHVNPHLRFGCLCSLHSLALQLCSCLSPCTYLVCFLLQL